MTLLEYLRQSRAVENEPALAEQAKKLANDIMLENVAAGGSKYPTADSMWRELLRRAAGLRISEQSDFATALAEKAKELTKGMRERVQRDPDIADYRAAFSPILAEFITAMELESGDKKKT